VPSESAVVYQLRRFRVAVAAVVLLPWLLRLVFLPFFGWHQSFGWAAFGLVLDAALLFFAWRNPSGLAALWIVCRLLVGAALGFAFSHGAVSYGVAALSLSEAILLIWLLAPMWRSLRREHVQAQLARIEESASQPDRHALKNRAKIERRGYV
jgi:hypothetical protein